MRLDRILDGVCPQVAAVEVTGLDYDSRQAGPGTLFFCVTGSHSDGHDHAPEAVRRGAAALVVQRPLGLGVPEIRVPSARAAMGPAAARFFDHPSRCLDVAGITGTNGKTTTAFLLRSLLEAAGRPCGLLGTVKSVIGGETLAVKRTTPEAIDLQGALRAMVDAGDRACAMEISSHALELGRADGVRFAVALFTNLTQDHLDFHLTMEDYYAAKRRLFCAGVSAVVNVDDPYGRRLAGELTGAVTVAIDSPADYRARDIVAGASGCEFTVDGPEGEASPRLRLPLPGHFNVANALGAYAAARLLGVAVSTIVAALPQVDPVPGRMEPVAQGQDFAVLVDYAHTPDSLANVLRAARPLAHGGLTCVFGCGGDRDRGKRPQMGAIAVTHADRVIVTSDNPRSERPEAIIAEILAGVDPPRPSGPPATTEVEAIVDRREAIRRALTRAGPGDVVIIAGKGHEQGQELADGRRVAFDDVVVAREALHDLLAGSRASRSLSR